MNGMNDFEKYLAGELSAIRETQSATNDHVSKVREDVAALKVQAGMFGTIGGAISASVAMFLHWLKWGR
jgi:hypothetical protein